MRRIFLMSEWEDMRTSGAVSDVQLASLTALLEDENSQIFVLVMEAALDPYQQT